MKKTFAFGTLLLVALSLSSCYTIVRDPSKPRPSQAKPETESQYTEPDYSSFYRNYPFYYQAPYPYYYNRFWYYDPFWSDYYFYNRFYRFAPYRPYYYDWYGYGYYDPFSSYYSPYGYYPYGYYNYYWGSFYYPFGYYPYRYGYRPSYGGGGSGDGSSAAPVIQFGRLSGTRQRESKSESGDSTPGFLNLPMSSTTSSGSYFAPGAGGTNCQTAVSLTPAPSGTVPAQPAITPLPHTEPERDILPAIDDRSSQSNPQTRSSETPNYLPPVREKDVVTTGSDKPTVSNSSASHSGREREVNRSQSSSYSSPSSTPTSHRETPVARPSTTSSTSTNSSSEKSARSRSKK